MKDLTLSSDEVDYLLTLLESQTQLLEDQIECSHKDSSNLHMLLLEFKHNVVIQHKLNG